MKVDLQEEKQRTTKIGYISAFLVEVVSGKIGAALNLWISIFFNWKWFKYCIVMDNKLSHTLFTIAVTVIPILILFSYKIA